MEKEKIKKIVKEVLAQNGLKVSPNPKPAAQHAAASRTAPVVLNVFHPGVRKLETALEQVRMIEELAAKSSVFTVSTARQWVCGDDVRQQAGSRCILDNVKPQGVEKVLQRADIMVLPTFCFKTAAKVARLIGDDQPSAIVLSVLIQGKPVLATRDSFTLGEALVNQGIREEIERTLAKLESFGMVFCTTDKLAAVFKQMTMPGGRQALPGSPSDALRKETEGLRLITANDVQAAVDGNQNSISLAPGGIVTPLAADQAKEYGIEIRNGSLPDSV